MIYIQKFNEGIFKRKKNDSDDIDSTIKISEFHKTKAYKYVSDIIKQSGFNSSDAKIISSSTMLKILNYFTSFLMTEYNLNILKTKRSGEFKLTTSDFQTVITVYGDRSSDRRLFYRYENIWCVFRVFINEKNNQCVVIKVNKSFIDKFLSDKEEDKEEKIPETPKQEKIPETPKQEKNEISQSEINELLFRFSPFESIINKKYNGLFDINDNIMDEITNMICNQYNLYVKKQKPLFYVFSLYSLSSEVLRIYKEITLERNEFYKDGDWYIFRIFLCDSNRNICLSVAVHKIYLNNFLGKEIKKNPWVEKNEPIINKPPVQIAKKTNTEEMKELITKIKNKKLNK